MKKKNKEEKIEEDIFDEEPYEEEDKPKSSKLFIVISIIIAIAIVIAGGVFFVLFFCNIQKVKMEGNTVLIQEEIEQDLFLDEYDKNGVILMIKNLVQPRKYIPFVESMDITMEDLNTVNIKIHEKEIIGYLMDADKNRIYYGPEGQVQEISKLKVKGVPRVLPEGEMSAVSAGDPIPVREKSRRELLALQRDLKNNELKVSRIEISEEGNFTLYHKDIVIKLGTASNMTEKVMRLKYILPKVKKKVGILHLEDWTEGNTDIVFEMVE
ncbi:MAG: cell division protein FtsQ/DivIB [Lachnospiraceae bacterium]|nr:cell division protein FtsQ/DivIB [Lachnospiraceae bacterium]